MSTSNLLDETVKTLTAHKISSDDVRWVGSLDGEYAMSWSEFAAIAATINYDNGYGGAEINEQLVVVGANWWLERHEYDGSEWWEFKDLPKRKKGAKPFSISFKPYETPAQFGVMREGY